MSESGTPVEIDVQKSNIDSSRLISQESCQNKLDGDGKVLIFFKSNKLMMAQFELPPFGSLNLDVHPQGDEGYFVIDGICTVVLPDSHESIDVFPGQVFYIKTNEKHIATNRTNQRVTVLAAIAPEV